MNQKDPLEALINWYEKLPLEMQTDLARIFRLYTLHFVDEENLPDFIEEVKSDKINLTFKDWLKSDKIKSKSAIIGIILCIRAIISFYIREWDKPFDQQAEGPLAIFSSLSVKFESKAEQYRNLGIKGIQNIHTKIEVKQSWDEICKQELSDGNLWSYSLQEDF